MNRFRIKVGGQSGAGLLSTGEIILNALAAMGFNVVADREYPSLIKGGHSCFAVNASEGEIYGLSEKCDVMVGIDKPSLDAYFDDLKDGGILVHGYSHAGIAPMLKKAEERGIKVVYVDARAVAIEHGGNVLMQNVVLLGMLWKTLGFDYKYIEDAVTEKFASKPKILEIDLKCLMAGYEVAEVSWEVKEPASKHNKLLIDGNHSIALGAIHCGVKAYFAYPMSPASSILTHLAAMADKTGMLVKQAEDEITAAQMSIGAMFMGTRAFTATSGGGYDLMTESVSLAGIIENPLVITIVQRPGPATGLPTWTMQGDLNLAMHSSHGEFPRVVMAVSDPTDCFDLIQHAFNFAEEFQVVVILLSEKQIAETKMTVDMFEQKKIPIVRGLVEGADLEGLKSSDRYAIVESGLSKRWLPGSCETFYFANGDEHGEDGVLDESAENGAAMCAKRMRKMDLIKEVLPAPEVFGEKEGAHISFIGWGSSKNIMKDIIAIYAEKGVKVNYLHYSFIMPFREAEALEFFEKNGKVCLIEGNYTGQFGHVVESSTDKKFADKLLKYNGRAFYLEDVMAFIDKHLQNA